MKKLLVLALVLSVASLANASLSFTIGGVDAGAEIAPAALVTLQITGDGADSQPTPYLVVQGAGSIAGGTVVYDAGSALAAYKDAEALLATYWAPMTMEEALAFIATAQPDGYGFAGASDFALAEIISDKTSGIPATTGLLVDGIGFSAVQGSVVSLFFVAEDGTVSVADSLLVTPEPMTMALLGLGGLFLRRRK